MDSQERINAMIAYFFLWPIFLLAPSDTPLSRPYVKMHAKKASIIILIWVIAYMIFRLIKNDISFFIFGFSLSNILLSTLMWVMSFFLIQWAYKAYHGNSEASIENIFWEKFSENEMIHYEKESEKIRLLASFLPLFGIYISSLYEDKNILIGRKVWSLFLCLFFLSVFFFGWATGIALLFLLVYIAFVSFIGVSLFVSGTFHIFPFYKNIPTYTDITDSITAIFLYIWEIFWVIFWKEKEHTLWDIFSLLQNTPQGEKKWDVIYFIPTWIIALPFINLITFPTLWIDRYRAYRPLIIQGFMLTIFSILLGYLYGFSSTYLLVLLFPIVHILAFADKDINTHVPFFHIFVPVFSLFFRGHSHIQKLSETGEKVSFIYEEK